MISECNYCFSLHKGRIRRGLFFCEIFLPFIDFKVVWLHLENYPIITKMLASIDHQFTICFKTLREESTCLQFYDCGVFKLSLHRNVLEKRLDFKEQNLSKLSINASYNESMRVKEYYTFLRQF